MPRAHARNRVSLLIIVRWLLICLPVGLFFLWSGRSALNRFLKLLVTCAAIVCAVCIWMGAMNLIAEPGQVMAQSSSIAPVLQEMYPLLLDPDVAHYHLEGCAHAQEGAEHTTLALVARLGVPADELCNPPRYDTRN